MTTKIDALSLWTQAERLVTSGKKENALRLLHATLPKAGEDFCQEVFAQADLARTSQTCVIGVLFFTFDRKELPGRADYLDRVKAYYSRTQPHKADLYAKLQ